MINTLDTAMFYLINTYARAPFLDDVLPYFSKTWILWAATFLFFIIFAIWCRKRYGEYLGRLSVVVITITLSVAFSTLGGLFIQDATERERPYEVLAHTNYYDETSGVWLVTTLPPAPQESDYAMPSLHAANTMAIALAIALLCSRMNPWIFFVPIMVAWSRVYMGMQYPMDVFAGWFWGMLSVVIVWWLCNLCFSFFTKNRNL